MLDLQNNYKAVTIKDITLWTITLSGETAAPFNCKKLSNECFNRVGEVHDTFFGYSEQFGERLDRGYAVINDLTVGLLTDQININSTESRYRVT